MTIAQAGMGTTEAAPVGEPVEGEERTIRIPKGGGRSIGHGLTLCVNEIGRGASVYYETERPGTSLLCSGHYPRPHMVFVLAEGHRLMVQCTNGRSSPPMVVHIHRGYLDLVVRKAAVA